MADPAQLTAEDVYLTDGGLETTLVFLEGIDLPDFAAFPLLDSDDGRAHSTATSRPTSTSPSGTAPASCSTPPPGERTATGASGSGTTTRARRGEPAAVDYIAGLADARRVTDDGAQRRGRSARGRLRGGRRMTRRGGGDYHSLQAEAFAGAGAQMMTARHDDVRRRGDRDRRRGRARRTCRWSISFTVETDGRLPSGRTLGEAIDEVDAATDGAPAYFMVNCAHPTHFAAVLEDGGAWVERVQADPRQRLDDEPRRARRGRRSWTAGDVAGLARHYGELRPDAARHAGRRWLLRHRRGTRRGDRRRAERVTSPTTTEVSRPT